MASKKSKKSRKATEAVEEKPQIRVITPQQTPQADRATQLVNELINVCIEASFDAIDKKCDCPFYKHVVRIARIVKELYSLRRGG